MRGSYGCGCGCGYGISSGIGGGGGKNSGGIGHRSRRLLGRQGIENAGDAPYVAAEGGEALLQRLLVADVGQHLGAPGQLRRALAGQKQAGPGHQCRQSHAF